MFDGEIRELVEAMEKHKEVVHKVIDERNSLREQVTYLEGRVNLQAGTIETLKDALAVFEGKLH